MNQIAGNSLKKNRNAWAIFSIINNTKIEDKTVVGWKIVAGKKITVQASFHIIRKFRNEIVVRAVSQTNRERLVSLATGTHKLNFYLPQDMVLFQSKIKQIEANGDLRIEVPEMIAQIDRRKYLRLFVENGIKAGITFQKKNHGLKIHEQEFKKECFDLSAGGLSFIISKTEVKFFEKNDHIEKIILEIGNQTIELSGKVINIFEVEPNNQNGLYYKGWKVCIENNVKSENGKSQIDEFVFKNIPFDEAM